jgi:hypothetical protein
MRKEKLTKGSDNTETWIDAKRTLWSMGAKAVLQSFSGLKYCDGLLVKLVRFPQRPVKDTEHFEY